MSETLVLELDAFRGFTNERIFISCGTQGKHAPNSKHYTGNAVDIIFPGIFPGDLPDLYFAASRFVFTGIGVYPYWEINGVRHGGLHLEISEEKPRRLWMRAENDYLPLTFQNLKLHC